MSCKSKVHESEKASAVRRAPEASVRAAHELAPQAQSARAFTQALTAPPQSLAPADILALQQSVGNLTTQQVLGAMLGQSGVSAPVQAKLMLGAAGDRYEQEADRVAAEVTSAPARAQEPPGRRATEDEGKDLQMKSPVSRVLTGGRATIAPGLESAVGRARGGGQSLPHGLRARMERAFGADFSNIHVHTDAQADGLNRSLEARAFTAGRDLFFRSGEYSPDSRKGQELIAHELTHVLQQGGGRGRGSNAQPKALAPVLQRMSLDKAGLDTGLAKEVGTFKLAGDGRMANSYEQDASAEAANKTEALQKAAEMNAAIGKRTTGKRTKGNNPQNEPWQWTPKNKNLNEDNALTLDPFFYRVNVDFKTAVDGTKQQLMLYFQHASDFTGYIESIRDTTNEAAAAFVTMYDKNDKDANKPLKATDKFSNVHSGTKGAKLIDLTSGKNEESLDAYTKIAGEGARWKCVRNLAATLRDDSIFYVKKNRYPRDIWGWGVTFKDLWGTWASAFNKQYDIADSVVANKLLNDNVKNKFGKSKRKEVKLSQMTSKDYEVKP